MWVWISAIGLLCDRRTDCRRADECSAVFRFLKGRRLVNPTLTSAAACSEESISSMPRWAQSSCCSSRWRTEPTYCSDRPYRALTGVSTSKVITREEVRNQRRRPSDGKVQGQRRKVLPRSCAQASTCGRPRIRVRELRTRRMSWSGRCPAAPPRSGPSSMACRKWRGPPARDYHSAAPPSISIRAVGSLIPSLDQELDGRGPASAQPCPETCSFLSRRRTWTAGSGSSTRLARRFDSRGAIAHAGSFGGHRPPV